MRRVTAMSALAVLAFGGSVGCVGDLGGGPGPDDETTEEQQAALCVVDTPVRRLTRVEYDNTVRDLFGDVTSPASGFPPEEEVHGFDNQAAALTVSDLLAELYMKAAEGVSERATADLSALLPGCDPAVDGDAACSAELIAEIGRKVYRRPLADQEVARLQALFDFALGDPEMGTFRDGAMLVLQAMLQSPHFLYRPEFGGVLPEKADLVRLTSWEIASKLSYMLWNTMPDDELFAAAEAGQLTTKAQIEAQARRMLAHPRAKDAIQNFHRQWLKLVALDTVSKDTTVYPMYNDGVRDLWKQEIESFIEHVLLEDDAKLSTLLAAPYTFANADLAAYYGADVTGPLPQTEEFEQVTLDPKKHAGLLTQGALMAVHAEGNQSSPVFRGKFVREQLLCQSIPIPPADLVIEPPPLDPTKTTREQFEVIGANPDCAYCHSLMNPIGFIFENFDGVGLWRDTQNGKPIDASAEITDTDTLNGFVDGPVALAEKLAASPEVATCVASQWFRFSYNRTVTQDDSQEGCGLDEANTVFAESGYDIRELLIALTQTDTFVFRHQVVAEGGDQ
jgi:hypothetical protein